jgi:IS6 family transposase
VLNRCRPCRRSLTERSSSAFRGFRFPDGVIAVAIRWYLRFRLPYADVVELLAERGVHVGRTSVFD